MVLINRTEIFITIYSKGKYLHWLSYWEMEEIMDTAHMKGLQETTDQDQVNVV